MKKQPKSQSNGRTTKHGRRRADAALRDFDKKDLGADIRKSAAATLVRPKSVPTSILLDPEMIQKLKEKGAKRGLGYQTMLKMVVAEHIDSY